MISFTVKEIAHLLNRREKYVYLLLNRKGISLKQVDYERLVDLVCEYRLRRFSRWSKRFHPGKIKRLSAICLVDRELFSKLYEACKEAYEGKCCVCGEDGSIVHHIDLVHGNMNFDNVMYLCNPCHLRLHGFFRRKSTS